MKPMSVAYFLVLVLAGVSASVDREAKRSFSDLGCMGVYDKAKFARLDRVCEECYQLFRESDVHTSCRSVEWNLFLFAVEPRSVEWKLRVFAIGPRSVE
ncbi:Ion transport peptide like protein [Argiope bruennichi]|nr:Ion transport peptide like protein [Argiope bruennichi]